MLLRKPLVGTVCFACRAPTFSLLTRRFTLLIVTRTVSAALWSCRTFNFFLLLPGLWSPLLQAVTFVDPAIRRSMPSRPTAGSSVNRTRRLPGGGDAHDDAERQELPFRMAVEVSALCEMEEALRVSFCA